MKLQIVDRWFQFLGDHNGDKVYSEYAYLSDGTLVELKPIWSGDQWVAQWIAVEDSEE